MKEKLLARTALKVLFWVVLVCLVFIGTVITSDILGYKMPITGKEMKNMYNPSQRVPWKLLSGYQSTFYNKSKVRNNGSRVNLNQNMNFKTRVLFLKVFKAGSTTIQNLLFRFGLRHKLNIVLPENGRKVYPYTRLIPLNTGQHFDIFACHTVYRKAFFDSLLPSDSVRIGIVREPISRMISAAYYYRDVWGFKYLKKVPETNFIQNIVNFPEKYDPRFFSRTKNSMAKDFGLREKFMSGEKDVKRILRDLNKDFLLVMVMEQFDESLILLKRALNWSFLDILYLRTNSHQHKTVELNETEKAKFKDSSFLDFAIYEYFSDIFETKLRYAGNDFEEEVKEFKKLLKEVNEFCLKGKLSRDRRLVIEESKWNNRFNVWRAECNLMKTGEMPFIKQLRSDWSKTHKHV